MDEYKKIDEERDYIDWQIAKKRLKKDLSEIIYGLYFGILISLSIVVYITINWILRVI